MSHSGPHNSSHLGRPDADPPTLANSAVTSPWVVCPGCGCLCDDLRWMTTADGNRFLENSCSLGREWFQPTSTESLPRIDGRPAGWDEAISAAVAQLQRAKRPTFWIREPLTAAEVNRIIDLAEGQGGWIIPEIPMAPLEAFAEVGEATATLGELRHRADVILVLGADLSATHPRLFERTIDQPGTFVPDGRAGRRLIALDAEETATTRVADEVWAVPPGSIIDILTALRLALQFAGKEDSAGEANDQGEVDSTVYARLALRTGQPIDRWRAVIDVLRKARYAFVFLGDRLTPRSPALRTAAAIEATRLVQELHRETRASLLHLGDRHNLKTIENVLAWRYGQVGIFDLSRGEPTLRTAPPSESDLDIRIHPVPRLDGVPKSARSFAADTPQIAFVDPADLSHESRGILLPIARLGTAPADSPPASVFRLDGIALPIIYGPYQPSVQSPVAAPAPTLLTLVQQIATELDRRTSLPPESVRS